jgi:hypothetical protein
MTLPKGLKPKAINDNVALIFQRAPELMEMEETLRHQR